MINKIVRIALILMISASMLFGYSISIPEAAVEYQGLRIEVINDDGDLPAVSARFYLIQSEEEEPLYIAMEADEQALVHGILPGEFVTGESLVYRAEIMAEDGEIYTVPEEGNMTLAITEDSQPPELKLVYPQNNTLEIDTQQAVIIEAVGEEQILLESITINGKALKDAEVYGSIIKGVYEPRSLDDVDLLVSISDASGNIAEKQFTMAVAGTPRRRFFSAGADLYADAELTYSAASEQESLDFPGELFDTISSDLELEFGLGGSAQAKAGPLRAELSVDLGDTIDILDYTSGAYDDIEAYPYVSSTMSDFYDVLRLWNPYAYNYTDGYGDIYREYESDNQFLADVSLFEDILVYRFGDQSIFFQDQTIKDMSLRGSSVSLDLPLLSMQVVNGFTDLGSYEVAFPRQFIGMDIGFDIFDIWYMQTNISIISDYQGPYSETRNGETPIGDLFGLVDAGEYTVTPEQNLVWGFGTGIDTSIVKLKGEAGFSLYVSDASGVTDIVSLVNSVTEDPIDSLDAVDDTIDMIEGYFPLFDYFPITLGIGTGIGSLWGITYGGDIELPTLNLSGFYRKTDGSYKSFGSSVSTGVLQAGGDWNGKAGGFSMKGAYDYEKNKLPDIMLNEIFPLVESFVTLPAMVGDIKDMVGEFVDTEAIPEVSHEAELSISSPKLGFLGRLAMSGSAAWEFTDTDGDKTHEEYQDAYIFGGTLSWKSNPIKFGDFSMSLALKTDDSYTMNNFIDGVADTSTYWEFGASGVLKTSFKDLAMSIGYDRDWGTSDDTDTVETYDASITIKNILLDAVTLSGEWEENHSHAQIWQERTLSAGLAAKKRVGSFTSGAELTGSYTDAADDADDSTSWQGTVFGGISLL